MLQFKILPETIRYDIPSWPGFYVLIVPDDEQKVYNFYLTHTRFGIIHYMFGSSYDNPETTPEKLVELAHWNVNDYLPDYVKDCCTENDE